MQDTTGFSGILQSVSPAQTNRERRVASRPALIRFWRWLTCGRGRHAWIIRPGFDLSWKGGVNAVRACDRCSLVEVLE